ncbi:MAG: hypothetical protein DRQ47_06595, partial [Gammaproteobacteria bacterium]
TSHINRIEQLLGGTLFIRSSKGLTATPLGTSVYQHSKEMMRHWSAFDRKIKALAGADEGEIRVLCGAVIEQNILPNTIIEFLKDSPNINFDVNVLNVDKMLPVLHDGNADVAIGVFNDTHHFDVEQIKIPGQNVGFFVKPSHPLVDKVNDPKSFGEFRLGYPGISRDIKQAIIEMGFTTERALASDSYLLLKNTAIHCDLVVAGPEFIFKEELKSRQLVKLAFENPPLWAPSILIAKAAKHSPLILRFIDCLKQEMDAITRGV